jgi:hypothetical protein
MYRQLAEIDAIIVTQLAECARWCRSNPTSKAAHTGAGWRGLTVEPSMTRMTPPPLTDFSPQASLWRQGPRVEPQARWQAREPERRTRNPQHGEPSDRRRHVVPLTLPYQAMANIFRNTTKELRSVIT